MPTASSAAWHRRACPSTSTSTGRTGTSGRPPTPPRRTTASTASPPTRRFLSDVVRFDLPRLGDIAGLRGVHLQCHIGTDTVSLARLGARDDRARLLRRRARRGPPARRPRRRRRRLRQADVVRRARRARRADASTSSTPASARCAGCPTSRRWAAVVAALLRPGGRLFIREGHPMLWALDDGRADGLLVVELPVLRARRADRLGRAAAPT